MTALSPWIAAALADAQAAQRDDGWLTVPELERAGHDPHDAGHIARWGPKVVIALLAVVRTADAMPEPLHIGAFRVWSCQRCGEETDDSGIITHHPTCEWRMVREALAALAATTTP